MESLKLLAPLAWRNIWRTPRRTVITLIVVSVGMSSILLFAAFLEAWAASSRDRTLTLLTGSAQIHAEGFLDDPTVKRMFDEPSGALADALQDSGISGWAPRLIVPAILQSEYRTMPITLVGVSPAHERAVSVLPGNVVDGNYLQDPADPGIVIGRKLLDHLKTRRGKRVILLAQAADGSLAERSFTISGAFAGDSAIEEQFVFVGLQVAQGMLGTGERLSEIALRVEDPEALGPIVERLRHAAPGLDIRPWKELSPLAAAVDETMGLMIYIWLWVMFVLIAFGIVNTQLMAVFERVREFGLMQALGMKPRAILGLVTLESGILVGLGVLIGMAAAVVAINSVTDGIDISFFAEGAAMVGAGTMLFPEIDPARIVQLSFVVWALGVGVALWPARKAAKSSPMEAMKHVS